MIFDFQRAGARSALEYAVAILSNGDRAPEEKSPNSERVELFRNRVADSMDSEQLRKAVTAVAQLSDDEQLQFCRDVLTDSHRHTGAYLDAALSEQLTSFSMLSGAIRFEHDLAALAALGAAKSRKEKGLSEPHLCLQNETLGLFVELASQAFKWPMSVTIGDPLVEKTNAKVATIISCPPFGSTMNDLSDLSSKAKNFLGDDGAKTRISSECVALASAMASATERVVIVVSESFLFRMVSTEKALRETLVENGLNSVFSLPPGAIGGTQMKSALLVIDVDEPPKKSVRLVDASVEPFSIKSDRGRATLQTQWQMSSLVQPRSEIGTQAIDVPISHIQQNNFALTYDRYVETWHSRALKHFLQKSSASSMDECVEIIRPTALPKAEYGGKRLRELSPSDSLPSGRFGKPSRVIEVPMEHEVRARKQAVQAGDVLLSFKGTIGSVGIIDREFKDDKATEFWTAGQSFLILRPTPNGGLTSEALYLYLSSQSVHEQLKSLASGTTIPVLSIKDIKLLGIPVPTAQEQHEIKQEYANIQIMHHEIEQLQKKAADLRKNSWPSKQITAEMPL